MTVGELIKKLNKRDKKERVYFSDVYGVHEITDVSVLLNPYTNETKTIIMNGDGGRYENRGK